MQNNKLKIKFNIMLNKPNSNLDPYSINGLIEAEGSFSIKLKDKRTKYDINVGLRFEISMLANETLLLNVIIQFLRKILVKYLKFW
jgi:hypothetical protein